MSQGQTNPLLDEFRHGEVEREVRLMAASGAIAPRAEEQLALLVLLIADADPEVAAVAARTVEALPREPLAAFLARSDAPEDLRAFFAERGIMPGPVPAEDASQPLFEIEEQHVRRPVPDERAKPISMLPIMERVKLAMRGTREQRAVLIRDPNKLVSLAVLSSPKLTEQEVETFARMGNVAVEVLRVIGSTRTWIKNYGIMASLARNPRTPPAISVRLVPRLNARDIRMISIDRNVPDVVRLAARKFLVAAQSRRG